MSANRRNPSAVQDGFKTKITSQEVDDAYQAFAALRRQACAEPFLIENEYFTALQETAYARFLLAFEAMEPWA